MKKLLILVAVIAALSASSCVFMFECEITVENESGYTIDVALSDSRSTPSSYTKIRAGREAVFTVDPGSYYVYIKGEGCINKDNRKSVYSDDTWTITRKWNGDYDIDD